MDVVKSSRSRIQYLARTLTHKDFETFFKVHEYIVARYGDIKGFYYFGEEPFPGGMEVAGE